MSTDKVDKTRIDWRRAMKWDLDLWYELWDRAGSQGWIPGTTCGMRRVIAPTLDTRRKPALTSSKRDDTRGLDRSLVQHRRTVRMVQPADVSGPRSGWSCWLRCSSARWQLRWWEPRRCSSRPSWPPGWSYRPLWDAGTSSTPVASSCSSR